MQPLWSEFIARLSSSHSEADFCAQLEALVCQYTGAEEAQFFIYDAQQDQLSHPVRGESLPLDESNLPGTCALYRETILHDPISPEPIQAALAVPVRTFGNLTGVLALLGPGGLGRAVDVRQVEEMASVGGMIRETVLQREAAASLQAGSLDLLVRAVDGLPGHRRGHVERVARLASEMATVADLSSQTRQCLWQAAQYHDVGKLLLADQSPQDQVRFHPQAGANFLTSSSLLRHLAPLVASHHERFDGSGFPAGLAGDSLPLQNWILCLAEDVEEQGVARMALETFVAQHGSGHHPEAVGALRALAESGRLQFLAG